MEEERKEQEMRKREFCVCLSFSGTLFLGENVAAAKGFVRFSGKRSKVKNQVLPMIVAPFFRFRSVYRFVFIIFSR